MWEKKLSYFSPLIFFVQSATAQKYDKGGWDEIRPRYIYL